DTFSWNTMDRTRKSATATGIAGAVVTTDIAASGTDLGYFVEGDLVRSQSGSLLKVTTIGTAGGFQTITLVKADGTAFQAADLSVNDVFGHVGTSFGENSDAPKGRLYLPEEDFNYTHISRRSGSISRSEFQNKVWLDLPGGKSWYWEKE